MKFSTKLTRFAKDEVDNLRSEVDRLSKEVTTAGNAYQRLQDRLAEALVDLVEAEAAFDELRAKDKP